MKAIETKLQGLFIIETSEDGNNTDGCIETYNREDFLKLGLKMDFVQENQSKSPKGVLRGLHVQKNHPQGKLVRVVDGEIFDVAVDCRAASSTYGQWVGTILSSENMRQFYIPEGFAHGFYVIGDFSTVCYKVSNYWEPKDEIGIPWNDKTINITWPLGENEKPLVAEKDNHYNDFLRFRGL